ncbi:MAG TPA: hypothetical protein PLK12_05995 [Prolixibacteraceae bacterium]|nr:hypothetical protein [Prolixibacteraceae bacterium]
MRQNTERKNRRIQVSKIVLLLFVWVVPALNTRAQYVPAFPDREVIDCAQENLERYLHSIRMDLPSFGFNSVDEFDRIVIGHPYERQYLSPYFTTDTAYVSDERYFYSTYWWHVPLYVDDTIRSFIDVIVRDNELRYLGGGAKNLAVHLDRTEKHYAIPDSLKRATLFPEDHAGESSCGYITAYDSLAHRYALYPIIMDFNEWCETHYPPFQPYCTFRNYFISRHTGEYYNPAPKSQVVSDRWYFFPNPFSDELYLQIPSHHQNAKSIRVEFFSMDGRLIFREEVSGEWLY